MNLKSIWEWNKWGLRLSRAKEAIEKESAVDWKIALRKGAEGLGHGLIGVCVTAALAYLSDPTAVSVAIHDTGYSPQVIGLIVAIITGLSKMAANVVKHS